MKASYALRGPSRRTAPAAASDPATFMFGQPPDSQSLNAERHACGRSLRRSSAGGSDSACSLSHYLTTYLPLPRVPTQKQPQLTSGQTRLLTACPSSHIATTRITRSGQALRASQTWAAAGMRPPRASLMAHNIGARPMAALLAAWVRAAAADGRVPAQLSGPAVVQPNEAHNRLICIRPLARPTRLFAAPSRRFGRFEIRSSAWPGMSSGIADRE